MFPILFTVAGFDFETYPFVIIAGVFAGAYYFYKLCTKSQLSIDFISDYFYIFILGTIFTARIGGIIENFSIYQAYPLSIFFLFDGNYNFYAGYIGLLALFSAIAMNKKENIWKWLDTLIQPALLFFLLNSLADFVSGKNYGTPSNLPWSVSFNIPEVRYTIPIHPVQIYECIFIFFILGYLYILEKKRKPVGTLASEGFFLYFLVETILSFLRGTPETMIYSWISLSFILGASCCLIFFIIRILKIYPHKLHSS